MSNEITQELLNAIEEVKDNSKKELSEGVNAKKLTTALTGNIRIGMSKLFRIGEKEFNKTAETIVKEITNLVKNEPGFKSVKNISTKESPFNFGFSNDGITIETELRIAIYWAETKDAYRIGKLLNIKKLNTNYNNLFVNSGKFSILVWSSKSWVAI